MYTLSLFLLTLFSLYIGVFAFFRWDASFRGISVTRPSRPCLSWPLARCFWRRWCFYTAW